MKANQKVGNGRQDRAESGIGTMIVFIAFVIVAAVAAAVLINTSNNLQRKASETGKETTQEVAANIFIRDIVGKIGSSKVTEVYWYVSLAPGAEPIDLNNAIVRYKEAANFKDANLTKALCTNAAVDALADGFCVRDVYNSGDGDRLVLAEGDRVRIELHLTGAQQIAVRKSADVLIIPEAGAPVLASFKTPPSFGTATYMSLL